jgi:mono/diheme cytochrome c family protein
MEAAMHKFLPIAGVLLAVIVVGAGRANAQTPAAIAGVYEAAARAAAPGFAGFSAQRGEQLFQSTHGGEWSCASCHTVNPLAAGKHARTGKPIAPLAPAANAERFTSLATAEKWFKRNCNDVIGRLCTAQEKGDVLAYLMQQSR